MSYYAVAGNAVCAMHMLWMLFQNLHTWPGADPGELIFNVLQKDGVKYGN